MRQSYPQCLMKGGYCISRMGSMICTFLNIFVEFITTKSSQLALINSRSLCANLQQCINNQCSCAPPRALLAVVECSCFPGNKNNLPNSAAEHVLTRSSQEEIVLLAPAQLRLAPSHARQEAKTKTKRSRSSGLGCCLKGELATPKPPVIN